YRISPEDSNPLEYCVRYRIRRSRVLARDEVAVDNHMRRPGSQCIVEHRTSILERRLQAPGHPKLTEASLILLFVSERRHPIAVEQPQAIRSVGCRQQCRGAMAECSNDA